MLRVGRVGVVLISCASACSSSMALPDASTNSASAPIGSSGGKVGLPGVELDVPSGALSLSQSITITVTTDPAPAPYVARSPLFRFEPAGLTFALPATVHVDFAGDAASTTLYWSSASGGGFDDLDGSASGTSVAASVMHFSTGFAGARLTIDLAAATDLSVGDVGIDQGRGCAPLAASCVSSSSCCSGVCTGGVCQSGGICATTGQHCTTATDCCSAVCTINMTCG
jgi:hypothetical protein